MDEEIEAALMHAGAQIEALQRENAALRKDSDLLSWILTHPETAAEELEDAAGTGDARRNLERRRAGLLVLHNAKVSGAPAPK